MSNRFVSVGALLLAVLASSAERTRAETPATPDDLMWEATASGSIAICVASAPTSLSPANATANDTDRLVHRQIFDGLVGLAADGRTIRAGLARSWTLSEDGRTYEFQLRDDVAFHGNSIFQPTRRFGPADVVYSIERLRKLSAKEPARRAPAVVEGVVAVKAVGTDAVRITLAERDSAFLVKLALSDGAILSAEYGASLKAAGRDWLHETHPIGTGPFVLAGLGSSGRLAAAGPRPKPDFEIVDDPNGPRIIVGPAFPPIDERDARAGLTRLRLAANGDYWQGAPRLAALRIDAETDVAARYGRLVDGDCDVMPSPAKIDVLALNEHPEIDVVAADDGPTLYLAFNTAREPTADRWVRTGLAEALDTAALAKSAGLDGSAARRLTPGADDGFAGINPLASLPVARAHLAGAGLEAPRLTLLAPVVESGAASPLADLIAARWTEAGAVVTVERQPWASVFVALETGDYDAALLAWQPQNPDIAMTYRQLLSCDAIGAGNASRWCDAGFDELLDQIAADTDAKTRTALVAKAAARVAADLPVLPLIGLKRRWAVRAGIRGLDAAALAAGNFRAAVAPPDDLPSLAAPAETAATGPN